MTNEEFKALAEDARKECNRVDNEKMRYGGNSATALLGFMVHVVETLSVDNTVVISAKEWIRNRAEEWRARNEN